jgi:hypothetical protein
MAHGYHIKTKLIIFMKINSTINQNISTNNYDDINIIPTNYSAMDDINSYKKSEETTLFTTIFTTIL